MKIGVVVEENNINSNLDDRFGRACYFAIIDFDNETIKNVEFVENKFKDEVSGAGQKLALFLKEKGVEEVIVPELGPKAKVALKQLEIKTFKKSNLGTLNKVMENLKERNFEEYSLDDFVLRKA